MINILCGKTNASEKKLIQFNSNNSLMNFFSGKQMELLYDPKPIDGEKNESYFYGLHLNMKKCELFSLYE